MELIKHLRLFWLLMYPVFTPDSEKKELTNHIPSHYIASCIAHTCPLSFSHSPEKKSQSYNQAVEVFVALILSAKLPGIPTWYLQPNLSGTKAQGTELRRTDFFFFFIFICHQHRKLHSPGAPCSTVQSPFTYQRQLNPLILSSTTQKKRFITLLL